MCLLICVSILEDCENCFLHSGHSCGLFPLCIKLCFFKSERLRNSLEHSVHGKGLTFKCINLCVDRLDRLLNNLWHTTHSNRRPSFLNMLGKFALKFAICSFSNPESVLSSLSLDSSIIWFSFSCSFLTSFKASAGSFVESSKIFEIKIVTDSRKNHLLLDPWSHHF